MFGVSSDSPDANKAFKEEHRLPFDLLTDANSILRKEFGIQSSLLGLIQGRETFVINKGGTCIMSFNDQLNTDKHVEDALAALEI